MLKSLNSDTKELRATNQFMQTYIDRCKKERASYTTQKNAHFKPLQTLPSIDIV